VRWVDETAWTYTCRFRVGSELQAGEGTRRQLVFEGLDTFAEIYLDGNLLGVTENMFHPHRFDLPDGFVPGEHELEARFDSPLNRVNRIVQQRGPAPDSFGWHRGWARKAGYSYGWDWGPELPGAGVFRPVYLQVWSGGRIGWFRSTFAGDAKRGQLTIHMVYEIERSGHWTLEAELHHDGRRIAVSRDVEAGPGVHEVDLQVDLQNPQLWWPHGEGEPTLHPLVLRLSSNGEIVHQVEERIGLRTVEWVETPDQWGKSFYVRVNGRDIFAKGANWIPADQFLPRVTPEQYRRLLDLAVAANMNMLRVWGGGVYEDPHFYHAADKRGLMIWQDFMYACSLYPDDLEFRENALDEARWVIASLARHPSIVLWCGNNEIERDAVEFQQRFGTSYLGKTLWYEQLPEILKGMTPDAFYIPSSPIGGSTANDTSAGDRHVWSIWSGWRDAEEYRLEEGRFISEFGFQAPANVATWRKYLEPEEMNRDSDVFKQHNKQIDGPDRIEYFLKIHHADPVTFEDFVHRSQDVQARALVVAVDFWRSRRPKTMGTLIWQFNDCWPVTSWSLLDSWLRPKASFYRVARAYRPRSLVLIPEHDVVKVVLLNDSREEWSTEIRVEVHDFTRGVVKEKQTAISAGGASVTVAAELSLKEWLENSPSKFLIAELIGSTVEPRAILFPRSFRELSLPTSNVTVETVERDEIAVTSDGYAFGVWVEDEENPDIMFSDNSLDLLPGEVVRLKAVYCRTGKSSPVVKPVVRWIHPVQN
ncbi:MAG: glycoside hydrolase family 2 protein, partial [bacterium]